MKRLRNLAGAGIVGLAGIVGGCSDTPTTDSEFLYWTGAILQANAVNNPNLSPRTAGNVALAGDAMRGYAPMAQQKEINQQVIVQGNDSGRVFASDEEKYYYLAYRNAYEDVKKQNLNSEQKQAWINLYVDSFIGEIRKKGLLSD